MEVRQFHGSDAHNNTAGMRETRRSGRHYGLVEHRRGVTLNEMPQIRKIVIVRPKRNACLAGIPILFFADLKCVRCEEVGCDGELISLRRIPERRDHRRGRIVEG